MLKFGKDYLYIQVYRSDLGDCTHGGLTAPGRFRRYVLIFTKEKPSVAAVAETFPSGDVGALWLHEREGLGAVAVPVLEGTEKRWVVFGGNFVYSSDSRFRSLTGARHPIPVHDRIGNFH